MKHYFIVPLAAALALFTACGPKQSEADRNAEVERQVQQRIAAEKQVADQQRLTQTQADLDAREQALADKEAAAAATASQPPNVTIAQTRRVTEAAATPRRPSREPSSSERRSSASYGTFYQKLEPYGAWRETNDYGYVWQPKAAEESRSWRPYTDGHWAYTDAGWTWVSDEKFGWATYHYGRWVRLKKVGWCWVPGEEWAPAWVSWRTSKEYVGWAPLPPEAHFDRRSGIHDWADNYYDIGPEQYAFVSANELGSDRLERSVVPAERNLTIVNQTTNVTNITYNNTTVVNEGPNYDQYRSLGQRPIERYRLERRTDISDETARPIVRGEMIFMPAPVIGFSSGYDRPPTIRERLTDAVVDNGWAAITDRSAAERTRAKMKAEATPPPNAPARTFVKPVVATAAPTPVSSATAAVEATPAPTIAATSTPTATATPTPTASATPAATPRPTHRPLATPVPTPDATPTATPAPSATPTATAPEPTATPTSTPRASRPPRAESVATPVATPELEPTVSSVNPNAVGPRDGRRKDAEARAAAQVEKQAAEAARKSQKEQERQAKRADEERRLNEMRNARRPAPASTSAPEATAASEASAAEVAAPIPTTRPLRARATPLPTIAPESTPAAITATPPPSAVETPPPSEVSTDVRRHERGRKDKPGRGLPAAPAAAAQQAEPDAAADASATPVAASPAAEAVAPQNNPPQGGKKNKNRRPGQPKPIDGAATPEPSPETTAETPEP